VAPPVIIVDYDPSWVSQFEALRTRLSEALGALALEIEHVGSTAVPGLAAKPIIDINVVIRTRDDLPAVIHALAGIGYRHEGDLGVADREAFDGPNRTHHLYVCSQTSESLRRHLVFRDYLRTHPADAQLYANLKWEAALRFRDDRTAYTAAKSAFIADILERACATRR
jgi:GrpB-like predicted nucleotidyltransferase (UPF0157 family)